MALPRRLVAGTTWALPLVRALPLTKDVGVKSVNNTLHEGAEPEPGAQPKLF